MEPVEIRHPYVNPRTAVQFEPVGESRTEQAHKDETDINRIMKKYEKTGLLNHVNQYKGDYGDFTRAPEYQEALNSVMEANEMFMTLPAAIRKQFGNDPASFVEYVGNPENAESLITMGLAERAEEASEVSQKPTSETSVANKPPTGSSQPDKGSAEASPTS